ncbi:hypothetical protein ACIRU3_41370 [Streptomyces sp. NPDC101151]|uniref:hypothetical protein n=1 Tax=Streptomyces sp. NPDC101151 TaxID=3366115 RepID=UPI0038178A96
MREAKASMSRAVLVRVVDAELGECLTGIVAGVAADVLVLATVDDLGLSGFTGRLQVVGTAVLVLLWTVNLLVARPRLLRAFRAAVPVDDPAILRQGAEQRRHLRRGRVRVAAFVLIATLGGAYLLHWPLFGLGWQLILALGVVHTRWTALGWERRNGVRLWKPPLSAVGREEWRRSPYFVARA